jgi:hypothetical protein
MKKPPVAILTAIRSYREQAEKDSFKDTRLRDCRTL